MSAMPQAAGMYRYRITYLGFVTTTICLLIIILLFVLITNDFGEN